MPRTAQVLVALAVSFAIYGLLEPLVPRQRIQALLVGHGIVIGFLCYAWVKAEAAQRNMVAPGRSALWAGLFPLLGLPIYFFRTRPPIQALLATAKAALVLVGLSMAEALVSALIAALRG
jgi:hypothetical protein